MNDLLYKIFDIPAVYTISQRILTPKKDHITEKLRCILNEIPPKQNKVLDIGCGPYSWLFKVNLKPMGLDSCAAYIKEYKKSGAPGIVGFAENLPFNQKTFDSVWSVGLLHHLTDEIAKKSVREMIRVCRKHGHVIIFDPVMPESVLINPFAYLLRKIDRGRHVRSENENRKILDDEKKWQIDKFTYARFGLEMIVMEYRKS